MEGLNSVIGNVELPDELRMRQGPSLVIVKSGQKNYTLRGLFDCITFENT